MADEVDQKFELHPPNIDTSSSATSTAAAPAGSASSSSTTPKPPSGPIPMSMPSILRNPGTSTHSNRLSYLLASSSSYPPTAPRASRTTRSSHKEPQLGRRKQRRSDNARLLSNPHAVRPTVKDYRLHSNEIRSTFPAPASGSSGKAHSVPVPSSSRVGYSEPVHVAKAANEGQFGKSLRDAQRVLKRLEMGSIDDEMIRQHRAGELERFIWLVDREVRMWAQAETFVFGEQQGKDRKVGKVLLDESFRFTTSPFDAVQEPPTVHLDSVTADAVGGQLVEFQRTPNALVWLVHDPFLRLIVHCLARVSRCPSFSKDDVARPGLRFTWILNRNPLARRSRRGRRVSVSSSTMDTPPAARPAVAARAGVLDTPPTTDFDSQTESELDTDTDGASSLGDSLVLVPDGGAGEGGEGVDTDEEEAEILRRVRRWAIDSRRQRAQQRDGPAAASRSRPTKTKVKQAATGDAEQQDPDQTLTATAIAEEEDEEEDDLDDEVRSFSDA
ncbi:uncharacterized protein SRS1_13824 [Sporisorium reilianum f. sp. reilianum]|uniref:Uncharacterized protein n=1 Tax=Sporisorium reilianum f. sp. reilianum TaxID=72559 RepID=A0A2N8UDX6_9BASI|nr:uncharacterized protein SRS1_13824 [Sporisorium reilianum f. sp. reilianum]